jgi:glycosyltransferase involved in cell wall biosynthesis
MQTPHVTTLHGRQDLPELARLYEEFADLPLVSISDAQRAPLPRARFEATVYHGLPEHLLQRGGGGGGYLAFTGRMSPEKQPDVAIDIARRAGVPLKMAAKVDAADRAYFHSVVEPLLDGEGVEFIGEINDEQKQAFLGEAVAMLFPINWPEPFGLVAIEAMACGTPTIAFSCGSVPEVIDDGVSGLVVGGIREAVEAVERARQMDRGAVRARFEARFTSARMAEDYLRVYRRLIEGASRPEGRVTGVLHGRHRPD